MYIYWCCNIIAISKSVKNYKENLIFIDKELKMGKNNSGGVLRCLPCSRYRGKIKDTIRRIWKECTERKAEDGQSI